ncbi:NADH dehydrogenase [Parasaccharibacter apium]|uniref:NADH dehydrogenase n=1 Tax=Parasaccharibacter apium TaxID=1510841 RepID=A0A7U7J1E5_9PROT|nr:NAD(P)/FAD-dependent oxidoreductase [Parasaccharibacter apium]CDG34324.1 NADH dehydrogenase [Parasaccharibacter apium]
MSAKKHVVILGGGVGGLEAATQLSHNSHVRITLIDQNAVHIWKPVLHELASGTIGQKGNLFAFNELSKRFGFSFIQSTLDTIDSTTKTLNLENGQVLNYDLLVVALGSCANDFGTPGAKENCLFLNTLADANAIHDRFRTLIERAQLTNKPVHLNIVGGGATGVQLAAELCQAIDSTPGLGPSARKRLLKPTLIEAQDRLLPPFPEQVSAEAKAELEKLGFDVITGGMVSEVGCGYIALKDGRRIESDFPIWAAGVKACVATSLLKNLELSRSGQIMVTNTLQTTKDPSIYAIGDCARMEVNPTAPTAQAARQEGRYVGRVAIPRQLAGKAAVPFVYNDRGAVVALGRYNAWGMWPSKKGFGGHGFGAQLARFIHEGLFRQHQMGISGLFRTVCAALGERFKPNNPDLNGKKPSAQPEQD